MELGDLKKWHIGLGLPLFFGLLVFAFLMIEPDNGGRTASATTFEFELTSKPVGKTNPQPVVQNVRIYPPINDYYLVRYNKLEPNTKTDSWTLQEWSFTAKTGGRSNVPVPEWLAGLQKQYPDRVSYTYEWWREPKRLWSIWGVFSVLMVLWGAVLPAATWVAKGGAKEFRSNATAEPEPEFSSVKAGPTAEDHDKLESMLDRLEEETAGTGIRAGGAAVGGATDRPGAPAGPAVLTGKPLEAIPETDEEKEARDFKGEFYPVARTKK